MSTDTLLENACVSNEELVEANQFLSEAVSYREPLWPQDPWILLDAFAKRTRFNLSTPLCLKHSCYQLFLNLVHINYRHIDIRSVNRS